MSTKRNHFNHHFFKVSNLVSEISEFIKIKNELNKIYEIQTDIYIKKGYINRNQARIIYKEFFRDEVEFSDLLQDIFKDLDFISINCIQSNYKIISNKYYLNDEIKEGLIDFYDETKNDSVDHDLGSDIEIFEEQLFNLFNQKLEMEKTGIIDFSEYNLICKDFNKTFKLVRKHYYNDYLNSIDNGYITTNIIMNDYSDNFKNSKQMNDTIAFLESKGLYKTCHIIKPNMLIINYNMFLRTDFEHALKNNYKKEENSSSKKSSTIEHVELIPTMSQEEVDSIWKKIKVFYNEKKELEKSRKIQNDKSEIDKRIKSLNKEITDNRNMLKYNYNKIYNNFRRSGYLMSDDILEIYPKRYNLEKTLLSQYDAIEVEYSEFQHTAHIESKNILRTIMNNLKSKNMNKSCQLLDNLDVLTYDLYAIKDIETSLQKISIKRVNSIYEPTKLFKFIWVLNE